MVSVTFEPVDEEQGLEHVVDEDLERFNKFFQRLGNDPLNKFEYAILKTYLKWKADGSPEKKDE